MKKYIGFTKVALEYGWLGNMAPFPITYDGKLWRTSEALFQALRFDDNLIREAIRAEKSPMGAKFKAKSYKESLMVMPTSSDDLINMRLCIKLKLESHPTLLTELKNTGSAIIFEDVSSRVRGNNLFWGAMLIDNNLTGENHLGKIWMELRDL